jgi:hypothetical protein
LAASVDETERYLDGIELAITLGPEAASANTAGAQTARGL